MVELEFFTDPGAFLDVVGKHLALDPVLNTVLASVTERARDDARDGVAVHESFPRWWLAAREGGAVVGLAMRTATFAPHPLYLLPMPDEAARAVARALHARGEAAPACNGALPAAQVCAEELAQLTGGSAGVLQHTRLFELGTLAPPAPPPGRLRAAEPADAELALAWFVAFLGDADEQAGRERGFSHEATEDLATIERRIAQGRIWLWVDDHGTRVHLTGANAPAYGVARIGPVYTPPEQRGRGYASAAVAEVSGLIVARGARACLFTDQANPTSNKIYEALGYRPVVDMADLVVRPPGSPSAEP